MDILPRRGNWRGCACRQEVFQAIQDEVREPTHDYMVYVHAWYMSILRTPSGNRVNASESTTGSTLFLFLPASRVVFPVVVVIVVAAGDGPRSTLRVAICCLRHGWGLR